MVVEKIGKIVWILFRFAYGNFLNNFIWSFRKCHGSKVLVAVFGWLLFSLCLSDADYLNGYRRMVTMQQNGYGIVCI